MPKFLFLSIIFHWILQSDLLLILGYLRGIEQSRITIFEALDILR